MEDSSLKKKRVFTWNEQKDIHLLREIAAEGVLQHKAKSRDRGAGWQLVASKLGSTCENVEVTSRAVRDHFKALEKRHKARMAQEERASGISVEELSEQERLLEELVEINEATERRAEEEDDEKKTAAEKERGQALEMRQRALERIGETQKRQGNNKETRKRRSSGETLEWLREKAEMNKKMREEELKEKQEQQNSMKEERMMLVEQMKLMHENSTAQLHQFRYDQQVQQQQQQEQFALLQQQMLSIMQQQQQQIQVLANLLKNN
ncbi:UPF0746 protein DDB_G0281095-like [Dendronephthya gigantea]|uniref:UPF0746 protein DDB_G0281095-like n=1 Tax=Dendronephthya gigantea TaxID=151771 RepID=UPI00106A9C74|nr:UPF0746 protein DDB_G0281095-like [Dendronephthya gigantea]